MNKTLELAYETASKLPDMDQERITGQAERTFLWVALRHYCKPQKSVKQNGLTVPLFEKARLNFEERNFYADLRDKRASFWNSGTFAKNCEAIRKEFERVGRHKYSKGRISIAATSTGKFSAQ